MAFDPYSVLDFRINLYFTSVISHSAPFLGFLINYNPVKTAAVEYFLPPKVM